MKSSTPVQIEVVTCLLGIQVRIDKKGKSQYQLSFHFHSILLYLIKHCFTGRSMNLQNNALILFFLFNQEDTVNQIIPTFCDDVNNIDPVSILNCKRSKLFDFRGRINRNSGHVVNGHYCTLKILNR